jgi:hypothetical protein
MQASVVRGELLAAIALVLMTTAAHATSWRNDGTGVYPDAAPPGDTRAWSTPLTAWSNASPVVFGGLVCVLEEPVTVRCFEQGGAPAWSTTHPVRDTLTAPDQAQLLDAVQRAEALQRDLPQLLAAASRHRRELRRGDPDGALTSQLAAASGKVVQAQTYVDAHLAYLTPPVLGQIGWSSPTPLTTPNALYVAFGNGMVTRLAPNGDKVWTRWLGAPPPKMRGYTHGVTASPIMIDDTLIISHAHLTGLDPTTGTTRWLGPEYPHYGTPAVAEVGGREVLITPGGEALDPATGTVLATGMGKVYYVAPVAQGNQVWFVGTTKETGQHNDKLLVSKVILERGEQGITSTEVWSREFPTQERLYATPALHNGHLYVVTDDGALIVINAADGETESNLNLATYGTGHFASPLVAGTHLVSLSSELGLATVDISETPRAATHLPEIRSPSTPTWHDGLWFVRTYDALLAIPQSTTLP